MSCKIAVLVSGRGSNLDALIAGAGSGYEVSAVIADRECPALDKAVAAGISATLVPWPGASARQQFSADLATAAQASPVRLVACAGFMRILDPIFLLRVAVPVLNIHPSLLPLFKGLHPQRQALQAGVRISGATVHFVTAELDAGPILAQRAVPVFPDDDEDRLSARILTVEHELYPESILMYAEGKITWTDEKIVWNQCG